MKNWDLEKLLPGEQQMLTMEKQALTQLKQRNSHHSQKMLEFCKQQALSQDKYQKECISAL